MSIVQTHFLSLPTSRLLANPVTLNVVKGLD